MDALKTLSWFAIFRLGLVQTALGSIVVLTTSTINRVMIVELALPAMLPGALVGLHYAIQLSRPRMGHGSDVGGRRTPWIIGGMAVLALGGTGAAAATALMSVDVTAGTALAVLAFLLVGAGVGASGTSLLVLLAQQTAPARRPAAATVVWVMMIVGFVITATTAGHFLDPFSALRLVAVTSCVCIIAVAVTTVAVWGIEDRHARAEAPVREADRQRSSFKAALVEVWSEPTARRFAVFVFASMLAYSAQDLILEPYAGAVFGYTPGESTKLAGTQHGGTLLGMILVALLAGRLRRRAALAERQQNPGTGLIGWILGGCIGSALSLMAIGFGGQFVGEFPLEACVFSLGFFNGVFAVAAIGSMMLLVSEGASRREGVRMGLWGASQAIAFGTGGFLGAAAVDGLRAVFADPAVAYGTVFVVEGVVFVVAAWLATRVPQRFNQPQRPASTPSAAVRPRNAGPGGGPAAQPVVLG